MSVTRSDIATVFTPSSIAVVGASDREGSRGAELLANLRSIGFPGAIHPVNPNRATVGGLPTVAQLSDLPAPVDVVAIGVDHAGTLAAVEQAVSLGVGAVMVLGVGYAEVGEEGRRRQDQLAALCQGAGVRLVGPNSLGVWSRLDRISYWLAPGSDLPLSGIGLVSQSGALASALIEPLFHRGIALDAIAATGNEADAGVADFLEVFGGDPRLRVLGIVAESLRQPQRLLAAVRRARAHGKPVICLLTGTSEAGREAAVAHSAALLGDGPVAQAYLQAAGAVIVSDLAAFTEHLILLARYPDGLAPGLAVTTVSGGGAGLIADVAAECGAELAALAPSTLSTISELVGGKRVTNPVDVALAGDVPGSYDATVAALCDDPGVGTVAIGLNLPHAFDAVGSRFYADQVLAAARAAGAGKDAVAFSFVPGEPDPALRAAAEQAQIPLLLGSREALSAIATAVSLDPGSATSETASPLLSDRAGTERAVAGQEASGHWPEDPSRLDEQALRGVLAAYGVPVVAEERVSSLEQAVSAAERIGYPIVLRILAVGLTHKSEHGAVRLSLGDAEAVRGAYVELERVAAELDGVTVTGMSVQAMVSAGTELILGARNDPGFGRALLFGWGGVWVEAYGPPQVAPVPLTPAAAWRLIEAHFAGALPRARQIVDLAALHAALMGFSAALDDLPSTVDVLEVNPLILSRTGAVAVDAALSVAAVNR